MINYLQNIPEKIWFALFGMLFILLGAVVFKTCETNNNLKKEIEAQKERYIANLEVKNDTIRQKENHIGRMTASIRAYNTSMGMLKDYNDSLYKTVKEQRGKIKQLIQAKARASIDTIRVPAEIDTLPNNTYNITFKSRFSEPGFSVLMAGASKFSVDSGAVTAHYTQINQLETSIKLNVGFREYKDRYEVFATSPSDKVTISELKGVNIIAKDEPLKHDEGLDLFSVGFGITSGYDILNNQMALVVGFNGQIKIVEF